MKSIITKIFVSSAFAVALFGIVFCPNHTNTTTPAHNFTTITTSAKLSSSETSPTAESIKFSQNPIKTTENGRFSPYYDGTMHSIMQSIVPQNSTINSINSQITTIYGESKLSLSPDIAKISMSIENLDNDATSAKAKSEKQFDSAVQTLNNLGISNDKIIINYSSIYPSYNQHNNSKLIGYTSKLNFCLETSINDVQNVIDALLSNGIKIVNNVTYELSNYDEMYQQILLEAVKNAQQKAQALNQNNLKITEITEEYCYYRPTLWRESSNIYSPKFVGEIEVSAKVKVTFEAA